ncbi:MAG: DinB family protein [Promethearchaeota archaeon]
MAEAKFSLKEYAIDTLEIAYYNLLRTIETIKPETVNVQVNPDINPITWILGHVAAHMDSKFVTECQGNPLMGKYTWKEGSPYTTGQTKNTIQQGLPLSFKEIVDVFLQIGDITFSYLRKMDDSKFGYLHEKGTPVMKRIQRVSLHLMGHMGQIRIIRRNLNDPAPGFFVAGMTTTARNRIRQRFLAWWNQKKNAFA